MKSNGLEARLLCGKVFGGRSAVFSAIFACVLIAGFTVAPSAARTQNGAVGEHPLILAQVEEGDIDQSFDAYGDDSDEIFEEDETTDASKDTLLNGITWLGHSSFLIRSRGQKIYTDPYDLSGILDSLPKADIVLITHDHGDHYSPQDLKIIAQPATWVVSIRSVVDDLSDDIRHTRTVAPGDTVTVNGILIEAVPAYNIGKSYHPRDKGYVGFVIHLKDKTIYHAGDTDVIPEMKDIHADVALLPVGGKYTMDAIEAARAADIIGPKVAVPMHWGTIIGTWEDAKDFQARAKARVIVMTKAARKTGE
jgi:L-ascorbate metabolism protein UlaG (beta-lactamase superfamily)